MEFQASTQYGDWKGTAAADEHGGGPNPSFNDVFEATGEVDQKNEVLVGFEFFAGEGSFFLYGYYHLKSQSRDLGGWVPTLNADLQKSKEPIQVKRVRVEITRDEFFEYFKRFSVVLVQRGLVLSGREYEITE